MRLASMLRAVGAAASLLLLVVLATSGWGLMSGYVPSETEAFDAILYLRRQGGSGPFLRSAHVLAASALVVSGALALLSRLVRGVAPAERRPWWLAVSLYLVVLGFCFTGFLLPMDQNAYWGTRIRLGIVETVPVLGGALADLLRGGGALNASTLPRFYALHVSVLPVAALLLALGLRREVGEAFRRSPGRWLAFTAVSLGLLYLAAWRIPAPLEPRASAADTTYVPRPEWYFLWLFQLGKYLEAVPWLQSLVVPAGVVGILYAVPLLRPGRPVRAGLAGGMVLGWLAFTGLALYDDRDLPPRPAYEEAMAAWAETGYREECRSCHGESGKGDGSQARAFDLEARDFTSPDFWGRTSRERMRAAVRDGVGKDMPAFGRKLGHEQIEALLELIERRFRPADRP
jgi:mono/diheme cytochrome c family protein